MKLTTSLATRVPERVQLEAELAVRCTVSVVVVRSLPSHTHPFGAVGRFTTTVDAPLLPVHSKLPAVEPPVSELLLAHAPVPLLNVKVVPELIAQPTAQLAIVNLPV